MISMRLRKVRISRYRPALPPSDRAGRSPVKLIFGEEDEREDALYGTADSDANPRLIPHASPYLTESHAALCGCPNLRGHLLSSSCDSPNRIDGVDSNHGMVSPSCPISNTLRCMSSKSGSGSHEGTLGTGCNCREMLDGAMPDRGTLTMASSMRASR